MIARILIGYTPVSDWAQGWRFRAGPLGEARTNTHDESSLSYVLSAEIVSGLML